MGLETANFISDLVATNPTGSDNASTADDHCRLIKSAVKATFPNVSGAVTPTHTELNYVDGVTSAIQTQLDAKASASALNASNLTSGTVPDARFPATLPALNGSALTALNASNLGSGTTPDARLSPNVPLISTGSFTGTLTGGTTSPTQTINYVKVGRMVHVLIPAYGSVTSNSTSMTITGAPAAIFPSAQAGNIAIPMLVNNSSDVFTGATASVLTNGTISFAINGTGSFTASGLKGISINLCFSYPT